MLKYKYKVYKEFLDGNLKGLTISEKTNANYNHLLGKEVRMLGTKNYYLIKKIELL